LRFEILCKQLDVVKFFYNTQNLIMLRLILSHRLTNDTVEKDQTETTAASTNDPEDGSLETEARPGDKRHINNNEITVPPSKVSRFELETGLEENSWSLPENMLDYVNKYINIKIPDKEIKEKIMALNPVPNNIHQVPDLDGYMKQLLMEHGKTKTLHLEKVLKTAQERERNVFGPLSRLWMLTENSSFTDIAGLFEQTILLTGQSFHRLVYQRRYNILSTLIDNSNKVNELLKEHAPLLNEPSNTYLFGDEFEEILAKSTAAQKK